MKEIIRERLDSYIETCSEIDPEIFGLGINFRNLSENQLKKLVVLLNKIQLKKL